MPADSALRRTALLVGEEAMAALSRERVILFGVGGVGAWCAESLVRSGVEQLTIVDGDVVDVSNINRQLVATQSTIGRAKVDVLRARLTDIRPSAAVTAIECFYSAATAATFALDSYDCIIDCIDQLANKALLLCHAAATTARVYSSMGAARKIDPTQVRVAELWQVRGCPLGAALRKTLRRSPQMPTRPITCVYSEEKLDNKGAAEGFVNGSVAHIPAIFGFTLAGRVVQDIINDL